MGNIYKNQTKLTIKLDCGSDLTGVVTALIKYKKPDNSYGEFAATIEDVAKGIIAYNVQASSDIDQSSTWTFWAHLTYNDGKVLIGDPAKLRILKEGSLPND